MNLPNDSRARILQAAQQLIYSRSYAAVGVAEICAEAEVKKGSFYHFFPSKRDLTLAVLEQSYAQMKAALIDRALRDDLPPMARLQRLVDLIIEDQRNWYLQTGSVPGCRFGNLAAEQATQDPVLRGKVDGVLKKLATAFALTLKQAKADGEISHIDILATADAMVAYLEGVLLLAKTRNDPDLPARLLPQMTAIRIAKTD